MTNTKIKEKVDRACADAQAVIRLGGGHTDVFGPHAITGIVRGAVQDVCDRAGFSCAVTIITGGIRLALAPDPTAPHRRGAKPLQLRQDIEAIRPGLFDSFSLEQYSAVKVRSTVQAVRRATGREFITNVQAGDNIIMVTRVDSLDQASPAIREAVESTLSRRRNWPFDTLKLGHQQLMDVPHDEIFTVRALISYQKRKHGREFTATKTEAGIVIARIS